MQGISDPQTFELSEVVKKSSKTGVFKNQRLLMIKDGFLYYFSNVPSDYKPNQTNVMGSFKEFPKCSIEIRSIQNIKLESAKSSTLIIIFHDKDMIDREDIRKSLSSKNYNHPVKQDSNELIQWSFIFDTVMKCRLWYGSLLKLKQYFVKNADKFDKFAQYMANFDPQIRSSLPQFNNRNSQTISPTNSNKALSPPKSSPNLPVVQNPKYNMEKKSGIFEIKQSIEEQDDQVTPKNEKNKIEQQKKVIKQQIKIEPIKQHPFEKAIIEQPKKTQVKKEEMPKIVISQPKKQKQQQAEIFSSIIQQQNLVQQKKQTKATTVKVQKSPPSFLQQQNLKKQQQQQNIKKSIEQQKIKKAIEQQNLKKSIEQQNIKKQQQNNRRILQQEQKAKALKKQQAAQQQKKIEEQTKKADQQRKKAEEKALQFSKQLQQKQQMIKRMAQQIQKTNKTKLMLEQKIKEQQQRRQQQQRLRILMQREKREQQEYKRLNEPVKFQQIIATPERSTKEMVVREESIKTEFQRDFIEVIQNGFKSTNSKPNRYSIKSDFSLNPISNQRETLNLFRNTISYISEVRIQNSGEVQQFDYFWEIGQLYKSNVLKQRITKELQLAEFVKKASQKATSLITHYIDMNKPKESLKIDRNLFEIEIVCDKGKVIRTEGNERLVYPNENHQRLKRCFKIYNQLNEIILGILKKKPNFPLRVPFACLVQYKGYTALARIIPPYRQNTVNSHHLRLVGPNIPLYNLSLNDFQSHSQIYTIIQPTLAFKPTKEDQTSIVRLPDKNNDFLGTNRKSNISICSKKLFQQAKEIEGNSKERLKIAQIISFCRQLKKYMKANTPYQDQNQFEFFEDFLKNPKDFMQQIEISECTISGILVFYIQKLLGLKLKQKWNNNPQPEFTCVPVKRTFNLISLDVNHFAINFERYLFEKKYQIAEKALSYFKQLQQDYSETLMKEVTLHIHQKQFQETLQKLSLSQELMSIHDPRRLKVIQLQAQCHEALGDIGNALSSLKILLEQTQYMYGKNGKLVVDVYFLIADLLSRQKLIPQLIQVYRKILQQNPDYRQKVLIDFSTNLLNEENTDPHILLDFLQKEIPQSIEQNHPQIQELLGQLYFKVRNKAKAIVYFTNALNNLINQDRKFNKISQILIRVIQCCNTLKDKKTLHRQIVSKMSTLNFAQHEECKRINTYICCIICQGLQETQRDGLIMFLQYHKGNTAFKLLDWNWTQNCLKKISKGEQTTLQQKNILINSINTNSLSQTLILLNNPNFI